MFDVEKRGMSSKLLIDARQYSIILTLTAMLCLAPVEYGRSQTATPASLITIHLEKKLKDDHKTVPQNTVFHNGEVLRFRLTSRIAGYLYVIDKGSSGVTSTLFPVSANGAAQNRIQPDQIMIVPAIGDGWFEVSGPSGFDTIYLLVSASPIAIPPAAVPDGQINPQNQTPSNLLPRCNDEIFKARGECLDPSAGVSPLPADAPVPRELIPFAKSAARDIILTEDGDGVTVHSAPSAKLPVIYTFRLAHLQ